VRCIGESGAICRLTERSARRERRTRALELQPAEIRAQRDPHGLGERMHEAPGRQPCDLREGRERHVRLRGNLPEIPEDPAHARVAPRRWGDRLANERQSARHGALRVSEGGTLWRQHGTKPVRVRIAEEIDGTATTAGDQTVPGVALGLDEDDEGARAPRVHRMRRVRSGDERTSAVGVPARGDRQLNVAPGNFHGCRGLFVSRPLACNPDCNPGRGDSG